MGGLVAGAIKSLLMLGSVQLECATVLHENGNETMI